MPSEGSVLSDGVLELHFFVMKSVGKSHFPPGFVNRAFYLTTEPMIIHRDTLGNFPYSSEGRAAIALAFCGSATCRHRQEERR